MPESAAQSPALHRVLSLLLDDPTQGYTAYDLMRLARVSSATLFPVISTLRRRKVLDAHFAPQAGGPERREYRLAAHAHDRARELLAQSTEPPQPRRGD